MDTDKMQKEQHNMDNDKFLNQINTQEDNLVKLIDRKLQELERLEKNFRRRRRTINSLCRGFQIVWI